MPPVPSAREKTPSQSKLKQQRRAEREAAEQAEALATRRAARLRVGGAIAAGIALIAVAAVLVLGSGGTSSTPAVADDTPFGTHYAGLQTRLETVGLPTMATPQANEHSHQSIAVYIDGKQVAVPESVGVDPAASPDDMAGLHTHTPGFTIHNEGVAAPTLGQFFAVWGVPFSSTKLGPYGATAGKSVRVWVNDKEVDTFERLPLTEDQRIVVSYGPRSAPKPASPPAPVA